MSALKTRGIAYAAIGEYDLALADFDNAIAQMPTYADAYRAAADVYTLCGTPTRRLGTTAATRSTLPIHGTEAMAQIELFNMLREADAL